MSYQVLARKWRPQTFSELVGQQHVVDAITNALDNNKLHHAYLFTGTRGVGKTTIARIFSKSLNCEEGQSANPCGKCPTCLDISEGRFVDLLEIDAASRTKVEDTRELLDNVQYKPTRGKYKVYLIDEVHMLSKHSFNALLKTLEEPPPHVKFLLATTDPQKLPVTILSRCLQFSLKSLSREQIQTQLQTILTAEELVFETPALSQIARAAAGSMRDALSLTDQAIAQGNDKVTLDIVVSMLGLLDKNQVMRLANCICERDADNAMKQLDEICADSPDYSQVLSQLLALLHQVALTQIVPDICKLDTNIAKPIYTLAQAVSAEHIQLLYQIGLNGKRDLPYAPDSLTGLQMTIMRMIAFTPAQSLPLEVSAPVVELDSAATHETAQPKEQVKKQAEERPPSHVNEHSGSAFRDDFSTSLASSDNEINAFTHSLENMHESVEDTFGEQSTSRDENTAAYEEPTLSNSLPQKPQNPQTLADVSASGHLQSSVKESANDDAVSQLQDLFDMEQDMVSYEREAAGDDNGKKSESIVNEAPKAASKKSISQPLVQIGNEQMMAIVEKSQFNQTLLATNEALPEIMDDTDTDTDTDTDNDAESDIDKNTNAVVKPTVPTSSNEVIIPPAEVLLLNNDLEDNKALSAYLSSGEKLVLAAQIDKWSAFVDSLHVRGMARQLLIHGRSPGIKDNCLLLEINQSHHHLNEQSSINSVKEALKEKFERDIEVNVAYAEVADTPYQLQMRIEQMRLLHAKQVIESDSAIQELMKAFDAKVVPDSIESR